MLPQRRPLARVTPREQKGACCCLAEAAREQGRTGDIVGDDSLDILRLEHDRGDDLANLLITLGIGQSQHDAVIGMHDLRVEPGGLANPGRDRERPGRVHRSAIGGVDDHPPVAKLVAKALDEQGAVIGQLAGGLALLVHVGHEVRCRPLIETGGAQSLFDHRLLAVGDGADECPHCLAEFGRSSERVTMPERQPARLTRRRAHEHPIVRDLLDPPTARPEGDHLADPRFVDHLLVELADPRALLAHHEYAEEPAIGDRAAARDGEPLRPGAAGEDPGGSIPDETRLERGEVVRRVAAAEKVEDGFEDAATQAGEGRGSPCKGEAFVHRPLLATCLRHRDHRDDLLGEHVQRIAGDAQGLDLPGEHALGHHRARDEVASELGEDDPSTRGADLMASATDPLQPGRHARRGLHLDHDIDRAHVDAEFKAARRDDGWQAPCLEVLLDRGSSLSAHRSVMGRRDRLGCSPVGCDVIDARGDALGEPP